MATIKLAILKNKPALDGSFKIRIAVCHKMSTRYIMTRFKIETASQFKNGMVVKHPQASSINTKLRNLLNEYQERLDAVKNISLYDCRQLRDVLEAATINHSRTFNAVANEYISSLIEDGRGNYAKLLERNARYFKEFTKGDFLLDDITPTIIENYSRLLKKKGLNETTVGMFMSRTRTIINRAKKVGLVKYDIEPFAYYKIKPIPCWLNCSNPLFCCLPGISPLSRKLFILSSIAFVILFRNQIKHIADNRGISFFS